MKLFALTNQGLLVIGLLICVLWGVLFAEHTLNQKTQQTYNDLVQEWPLTPAIGLPGAGASPPNIS